MAQHILVTGGAGFIGSHLVDDLLAAGHRVRVLDSLSPQVHENGRRPGYLNADAEFLIADIRDPSLVAVALRGVDCVVHLAARVGVGQSMYEVADYTAVNEGGTAVLLQALLARPVERLIIASSMSIYGEGLYRQADGQLVDGVSRDRRQLAEGRWDPADAEGIPLTPIPTPETKPPALASIYALNKFAQERQGLIIGATYGIPTVALRFFNVYGSRQALSNPYTGVLAIFAARLLNGNRPLIFEDGRQLRDFVAVADVVRAIRLALDRPAAVGEAINIGSGHAIGIGDLARTVAVAVGRPDLGPSITGRHRVGDIRHCFAEIGKARAVLGYEPRVSLEAGLAGLAEWLAGQVAVDRVEEMSRELARRGLTV